MINSAVLRTKESVRNDDRTKGYQEQSRATQAVPGAGQGEPGVQSRVPLEPVFIRFCIEKVGRGLVLV